MKKNVFTLLLIIVTFYSCQPENIDIKKTTYNYASKDGVELKLDKYSPSMISSKTPCVIFLFGGGFIGGERDNPAFLNYFNALVKKGIQVVSIDYRKGLENIESMTSEEKKSEKMAQLIIHSLNIATEDLIDATAFILAKSEEWNIDTNKIIVSGSSAGALTALQGEYTLANGHKLSQILPADFRYAGVISFAGAIFSETGKLEWKTKPAPMMLFHGNADKNVAYYTNGTKEASLYGSKYIANQLDSMRIPYYFYDERYGSHMLAELPMNENIDLILDFIDNNILHQRGLMIHLNVEVINKDSVNTNFTDEDYFNSNYGG